MNNIEEYDDRIEKFLRGEMSAMEEVEFKKDVASNPELQERAKIVSALVRGLKRKGHADDDAVIKETESLSAQPIAESTTKRKNKAKTIRMFVMAMSAAAVLILMFNIFISHNRQGQLNDIVTPYYTSYNIGDNVRGDEDTITITKLAGMFNAIGESDNCDDIIKELEPIYNSLDKDYTYRPYENDIAWYLSIAYIKDDQLDKAEKILTKLIADNPNTEIAEKAEKLLNDVKNIK